MDFTALGDVLYDKISNISLDTIGDVNNAWQTWLNTVRKVLDDNVPKFSVLNKTPAWVDVQLLKLIKKKYILRKKAVRSNSLRCWDAYKQFSNMVKNKVRLAYKKYLVDHISQIQSNPKKAWSILKRGRKSIPRCIYFGNIQADSSDKQVNAFNDYFCSVYNTESYDIPNIDFNYNLECLRFVQVDISVRLHLENINTSKAT